MTHFARELRKILAGPPAIPQVDVCRKAHLTKSKMSRLLHDLIGCDRRTLESLLPTIPKPQRVNLVKAYLRDCLGEQAISCLATGRGDLAPITLPSNGKTRAAVDFLISSSKADDLFIVLARSLGWGG